MTDGINEDFFLANVMFLQCLTLKFFNELRTNLSRFQIFDDK